MRKGHWILAALLVAALAPFGWAQSKQGQAASRAATEQAQRQSSTNGSNASQSAGLQAGTHISAELLTTLDARKLHPGKQVVARVTKPVKQDGRTVIRKGSRLIGHVTSVQASGNGQAGSQIGVQFDQLAQGHAVSQLNTTVTAVFARPPLQPLSAPMAQPEMAPMPAGGGQRGGGLLGGTVSTVGSAAGSTVGTVDQTAGGVAGSVNASNRSSAGARNNAGLGIPLANVIVGSSAGAQQQTQASSLFSTKQGNLRLDSGTQMELQVNGQAQSQSQNQPPQPPQQPRKH
jgi:hypothetical protein